MNLSIILLSCFAKIYISLCDDKINKQFDKINTNFVKLNSIAADIAWESSLTPGNTALGVKTASYQKNWVVWQRSTCQQLAILENRQLLNDTQRRQTYLLCRGPNYTYREARALTLLYDELQSLYSKNKICIPVQRNVSKDNLLEIETAILDYLSTVNQLLKTRNGGVFAAKMAAKNSINDGLCLDGEYDFEKLMKNLKNEEVLKWLWLVWREKIGEPMKEPYAQLVGLENRAAWRKGYTDIGASWREEVEVPSLRQKCKELYSSIRPLYTLLHGVVRFYLRRQYGDLVPKKGPIPAHLLGNLWSQNWETMADLITDKTINIDETILKLNWTVHYMVKRVEDFYQSLGLPAMTDTFWRESVFEKKDGVSRCHGTAADMFKDGDFRLLYCSGTTINDFNVLHHEIGHIQYYMAYDTQPGIYRQANPALHESIGDAIMYGVMTPQHLHRLGLVNDSILYVNSSGYFNVRSVQDNEDIGGLAKTKDDYEFSARKTKHDRNIGENDEGNDLRVLGHKFSGSKTKDDLIVVEGNEGNELLETDDVSNLERFEQKTKHDREFGSSDGDLNTKDFDDQRDGFNEFDFRHSKTNERDRLVESENDLTSDEILLLKQALNKLPQIPFSLVVDEYRWKYFEGVIDKDRLNKEFWDLSLKLQGIVPPVERGEEYFDVGAKFHVPDNTPYIRYFLSSFIQHQIFEALCRAAVFGRRDIHTPIPDTIPLSRCDIYGSKAAGKLLKDILSRGHSQHWREILMSTTGNSDISAAALQRYYRPLYDVLARIVRKNNIPLGW